MIFVAVSQYDGRDVVSILFEKIEIGNTDVHTVGSLFRETHARIKNQHLVAIAHGHAVHTKFANSPERDNFQNTTHFVLFSTLSNNLRGAKLNKANGRS